MRVLVYNDENTNIHFHLHYYLTTYVLVKQHINMNNKNIRNGLGDNKSLSSSNSISLSNSSKMPEVSLSDTSGKTQAYAYSRWSSDLQSGNSSKGRQGLFTEEVCREMSLELVDTIIDDGVSAKDGLNLESNFKQFIELMKENEVLIIEDFTRLSRAGFWVATQAIKPLIDKGIRIVVGRDEDGELIVIDKTNIEKKSTIKLIADGTVDAKVANEKWISKLQAAWDLKHKKMIEGKYVPFNKVPFWLRCSRSDNGKCEIDGKYIVIEDRAEVVRRIFDLYVNKLLGVHSITRQITMKNISGIKKDIFCGWCPSASIRSILRNKAVIGYNKFNNDIKVYPAIIDEALFYAAQKRIQDNSTKRFNGRPYIHTVNIFRGILQCSGCGSYLNIRTMGYDNTQAAIKKNTTQRKYLMCLHGIYNDNKCIRGASSFRLKRVEEAFRVLLGKTTIIDTILRNEKHTTEPSRVPALEAELKVLRKERNNLYNLVKKLNEGDDNSELAKQVQQSLQQEKILLRYIDSENIRLQGTEPVKVVLQDLRKNLLNRWYENEYRLRIQEALRDIITTTQCDTQKKTILVFIKNVETPILIEIGKESWKLNGKLEFAYETK
jgi:cell division protein FtsB